MNSYEITWQGLLHDRDKQLEFLSLFNQLARSYTEGYFGSLNNGNTYRYFNDEIITGNILVSKSLLNLPDNYMNENIYPLQKTENDSSSYLLCNQVKLLGVQFKFKADVQTTYEEIESLQTIAFIFWKFDNTVEPSPLIKSNIAQLRIYKPTNSGEVSRYELSLPSASFEHFRPYICSYLLDFAAHYFFYKLEVENTYDYYQHSVSYIKEFIINNDPQAIKQEVKTKAFEMLKEEFITRAKIAREMDESEIRHRNSSNNYSQNE